MKDTNQTGLRDRIDKILDGTLSNHNRRTLRKWQIEELESLFQSELQKIVDELETCPHYDRSLFRDGYTDDPRDRRMMLEAEQVKEIIRKRINGA